MLLLATARVLDDGAGQPAHLAVVEFVERQEQGLEVGVLEVGRGAAARLDPVQDGFDGSSTVRVRVEGVLRIALRCYGEGAASRAANAPLSPSPPVTRACMRRRQPSTAAGSAGPRPCACAWAPLLMQICGAHMECCAFLARGVHLCCGEGLLCPVRARDIVRACSVHPRKARAPRAPHSRLWLLCCRPGGAAHTTSGSLRRYACGARGRSGGQSRRRGGPLGDQASANCCSGRGRPLGGEFQAGTALTTRGAQSAANSRRNRVLW